MGNKFYSRFRVFLCSIAVLCLLGSMPVAWAESNCASTPGAAVQSSDGEALRSPAAQDKGYRVTSIRWDPVLNQRWATIARCDHPEWPSFSLRAGETNIASRLPGIEIQEEHAPSAPVVRAGDIVHLWRQENMLRIEVMGVAEESGRLGKIIRVRLLRRDTSEPSIEEQFTGIVRGPADVEMQP